MSPYLSAQASAAESFSDNNSELSSVSDDLLEDGVHVTARLLVSEYKDDYVNRYHK